jgi:hypothetical protein
MKRTVTAALAAVLTLVCAPALSGCQTWLALQSSASVQLHAAQALYVAEAAFKGASAALDEAAARGLLKGADAAAARDLYEKAHAALLAARVAKAGGDYAAELSNASAAIAGAGQIEALADTSHQGAPA